MPQLHRTFLNSFLRSSSRLYLSSRWQGFTRPRLVPIPANRTLATRTTIDEKIEEIQELYATAQDEFEIASEETEKNTTYAEEDRRAAREELDKVHAAYKAVVEGPDQEMGEQIRQRIGQRIRELDAAVKNMEELAMHQD